jgi:Tol biopolymer transport system component
MNADGSAQTRLTTTPGDDAHPHWYPDGTRIMFNSARNTHDVTIDWSLQHHEIHSMKPDGTDVRVHTTFGTVSTYGSISPNGKKIVLRMVIDGPPAFNWDLTPNARNRNSEVFVCDLDGHNAINLSAHPGFDGWPMWSPDGNKIIFSSNRNGKANGGQLFIINADGTGLRQITNLPGAVVQASFSADGKNILAYQSWEEGEVEYGNVIEIAVTDF